MFLKKKFLHFFTKKNVFEIDTSAVLRECLGIRGYNRDEGSMRVSEPSLPYCYSFSWHCSKHGFTALPACDHTPVFLLVIGRMFVLFYSTLLCAAYHWFMISLSSFQDLGAIKSCVNCPALNTWKTASRQSSDPLWYCPSSLSQVFEIFGAHADSTVQLVCGDTGKGGSPSSSWCGNGASLWDVQFALKPD